MDVGDRVRVIDDGTANVADWIINETAVVVEPRTRLTANTNNVWIKVDHPEKGWNDDGVYQVSRDVLEYEDEGNEDKEYIIKQASAKSKYRCQQLLNEKVEGYIMDSYTFTESFLTVVYRKMDLPTVETYAVD